MSDTSGERKDSGKFLSRNFAASATQQELVSNMTILNLPHSRLRAYRSGMRRSVILLAVPLAIALSGCSSTSSADSSNNSADTSQAKPNDFDSKMSQAVALGTDARDGDQTLTAYSLVCSATKLATITFAYQPQGHFCLVTVQIRNTSSNSTTVVDTGDYLYDASGNRYDMALGALLNDALAMTDLQPNAKVVGGVVFDIPDGVTPVLAELHGSSFTGATYFDLTTPGQ